MTVGNLWDTAVEMTTVILDHTVDFVSNSPGRDLPFRDDIALHRRFLPLLNRAVLVYSEVVALGVDTPGERCGDDTRVRYKIIAGEPCGGYFQVSSTGSEPVDVFGDLVDAAQFVDVHG